jgi:hypothetical protein
MAICSLRERPFFLLLTTLLLLVVVYPILHETVGSRELYDVLRTVVLLAAVWVIFAERRQFLLPAGLSGVLVLAIWLRYFPPGELALPVVLTLHALTTGFFLVAVGVILWRVFRRAEVTADSVAGALCAYILLGVVFAHLFWFIETAAPASFKGEGLIGPELKDPKQNLFAFTYYSLVTLASLGASDVTPVRAAARGVTSLEAVCGQFSRHPHFGWVRYPPSHVATRIAHPFVRTPFSVQLHARFARRGRGDDRRGQFSSETHHV